MINQVAQARPAVAAHGFAGDLPAARVTRRLPRAARTTADGFCEDGETLDTSAHPISGWFSRSSSPFLLALYRISALPNVRPGVSWTQAAFSKSSSGYMARCEWGGCGGCG